LKKMFFNKYQGKSTLRIPTTYATEGGPDCLKQQRGDGK